MTATAHPPHRADPIPAVREEDATGEVADIFADLRETLQVPFVNLIWRHLATMPPALAWSWGVVKPLHATGLVPGLGRILRSAVEVPPGVRQPACVMDAVGVPAAERDVIATLIGDYAVANAANLLCLLVPQALLAGEAAGGLPPIPAPVVRATVSAKVSLPGLDELPDAVRHLVLALDGFARLGESDAVATLYRHLAHWPGFLAVTHAALGPAQAQGLLRVAHERTLARARALAAERLLPFTAAPALPPPAVADMASRAIGTFTGHMIARMVAMGEVMLAVLPER